MTILSSLRRGLEAGAIGTLAMDTLLYSRYRRGAGQSSFLSWESSEGVVSWDDAPAPARVAKKLLERGLRREVRPRHVRTLNNLMHWGFGLASGAAFGLLIGRRGSRASYGLPFGAAVWAGGYILLPELGVYEPIWKYDLRTLEQDLTAHLVFGTATATAFTLLTDLGTKGACNE